MCDCNKILEWIEEELDKFPDENMEDYEVYTFATLELVKRQIELFKKEEKEDI